MTDTTDTRLSIGPEEYRPADPQYDAIYEMVLRLVKGESVSIEQCQAIFNDLHKAKNVMSRLTLLTSPTPESTELYNNVKCSEKVAADVADSALRLARIGATALMLEHSWNEIKDNPFPIITKAVKDVYRPRGKYIPSHGSSPSATTKANVSHFLKENSACPPASVANFKNGFKRVLRPLKSIASKLPTKIEINIIRGAEKNEPGK